VRPWTRLEKIASVIQRYNTWFPSERPWTVVRLAYGQSALQW
jgi:hypothetical protein